MNDGGRVNRQPDIESMFALGGGSGGQGLEGARFSDDAHFRAGKIAVVLASMTWIPLLILTAIEGVAWGIGVEVPFVKDFLPYGQFLLSIPILIFGEIPAGRILGLAVGELRDSRTRGPADIGAVVDMTMMRRIGGVSTCSDYEFT